MDVTLTMGNGVGTRMADGGVKLWSTGRLGGRKLDESLSWPGLEEGEGVDARSQRDEVRISPAGEPATGDNLTRSFVLPTPGCRYSKS